MIVVEDADEDCNGAYEDRLYATNIGQNINESVTTARNLRQVQVHFHSYLHLHIEIFFLRANRQRFHFKHGAVILQRERVQVNVFVLEVHVRL